MLIKFRVTNYRSIRDEQVLSIIDSKDKTYDDSRLIVRLPQCQVSTIDTKTYIPHHANQFF